MSYFGQVCLLTLILAGGITLGGLLDKAAQEHLPLFSAKVTKDSFDNVQFISNYDGDTITVNIPDLPKVFGFHIAVRVKHVDTPEIMSPDPCARNVAAKGRELVNTLLRSAKKVSLISVERDKYFRLLADVRVDSIWLHEYLTENKLAIHYEGEQKPQVDWCLFQ